MASLATGADISRCRRFSADIERAYGVACKRMKKQLRTRIVTKRGALENGEVDMEALRERKRACQVASGAAQLAELFRLLDSFGMQRSRVQKNLHLGMVLSPPSNASVLFLVILAR